MSTDPFIFKSFVTGSRCYGTPGPNSDIDLVVLISKENAELIRSMSDSGQSSNVPCRFGALNIILLEELEDFIEWKKINDELKALSPVSREYAKQRFKEHKFIKLTNVSGEENKEHRQDAREDKCR